MISMASSTEPGIQERDAPAQERGEDIEVRSTDALLNTMAANPSSYAHLLRNQVCCSSTQSPRRPRR